jgi:hypothetical protein
MEANDGRTDAERAYDALKDGSAYTKPESGALARMAGDENEIADWIDRIIAEVKAAPAMLDAAAARRKALSTWKGEMKTHANGNTLRYPALEEVEIGQLADGTPIYGEFDNDDRPLVVVADWGDFSIVAGGDGPDGGGVNLIDANDETGREYDHITLSQWERLKALVVSGVVDQALHFAKVWHAQRAE